VFANLLSKDFRHQIGKAIHDARLVSKPSGELTMPKTLTTRFT
jgi:hypothetical protein